MIICEDMEEIIDLIRLINPVLKFVFVFLSSDEGVL